MLQRKEQLELERQILSKTDLLIETAMEASMLAEAERDRKLDDGIQTVAEIASLLEAYLGGHPEHFDTLLRELTKQKLPDDKVLESFGEFSAILDTAIRQGLERYRNLATVSPEPEPVTALTAEVQEDSEGSADGETAVEEAPAMSAAGETAYTVQETAPEEPAAGAQDAIAPAAEETVVEEPVTEAPITAETAPMEEPVALTPAGGEPTPAEPAAGESAAVTIEPERAELQVHSPAGTSETQENTAVDATTPACTACDHDLDAWELALRQVFPGAAVYKDYCFKGLTFSYFLPEKAIAIDLGPGDRRETVWKEYYCRREKIRRLALPAITNARPRQIVRLVRQLLAQNPDQIYTQKSI